MSVRARISIPIARNLHVTLLANGPATLPAGTEGVISAISRDAIDLNCRELHMTGIHAWGIKVRIARPVFGVYFESVPG